MIVVDIGDVGKRVRAARLGVRPVAPKQAWLADQLGVSSARLSNWENGKHDPPEDIVEKVAKLFDLPESYFYDERPARDAKPSVSTPLIPVSYAMVEMKYAGIVPAGDWGDPLASEDFIEVEAKFDRRGRYATTVMGDSCYPALKQGDVVIWQQDYAPQYGLIVLAQRKHDHACTVKQLDYDGNGGRPVLKPINPAHDEQDDVDGWGAIARLVAVIRNEDGMEKTWYLSAGLRARHLTS